MIFLIFSTAKLLPLQCAGNTRITDSYTIFTDWHNAIYQRHTQITDFYTIPGQAQVLAG
jgi:hypothetical protein